MSDLSPPLVARLAPLVARLGTDHEGEVIAVVRALRRLLAARGLTFTDVARALEPQPVPVPTVRSATDWEPTTWHELARWVVEHDEGHLQPRDREFALSMVRQLVLGGEPSPRQAIWLRNLYARLGREE